MSTPETAGDWREQRAWFVGQARLKELNKGLGLTTPVAKCNAVPETWSGRSHRMLLSIRPESCSQEDAGHGKVTHGGCHQLSDLDDIVRSPEGRPMTVVGKGSRSVVRLRYSRPQVKRRGRPARMQGGGCIDAE